jgi:hypothetical protein
MTDAFDKQVKVAATRLRDLWGTSHSSTYIWLESQLRDLFRPLFDKQADEIERLREALKKIQERINEAPGYRLKSILPFVVDALAEQPGSKEK